MLNKKYVKKPDEIQAAQFLGGSESGAKIVDWINRNHSVAVYLDELPSAELEEGDMYPGREEGVRVITDGGFIIAAKGDYVIRLADGVFDVLDEESFNTKYSLAEGSS